MMASTIEPHKHRATLDVMRHPTDAGEPGAEITEFAMALYGVTERLRGEHERAAARAGITPAQATVLTMLSTPMPMRGLAERMGCDPSNITGIVDRLEDKGLVQRNSDSSDRRVKQISATPAGRDALASFRDELVRTSSITTLSAEARHRVLAILRDAQGSEK